MSLDELHGILKSTGIPVAYNYFPDENPQIPPYICYRVLNDNNFVADGQVYLKGDMVQIELYTDIKNEEIEHLLESALSFCVWTKEEEFIQKEKIYQVVYEIGV